MTPIGLGLDAALLVRLGHELRQSASVTCLLERVQHLLEAETCLKCLFLLPEPCGALIMQPPLPVPPGGSLSAAALLEQWGEPAAPRTLPVDSATGGLVQAMRWEGVGALCIAPIPHEGSYGMLIAGLPTAEALSDSDCHLLHAVADQVGLGLQAVRPAAHSASGTEASLLLELANLLGGMRSLPELLDRACRLIRERLDVEATILLTDGEDLVGRASSHLSGALLRSLRAAPDESILYRAVAEGYVQLTDVHGDPIAQTLIDATGEQTGLLGVRIDHQGAFLGLLVLVGDLCGKLHGSSPFLSLCQGVAQQIGLPVQQLLLHDRLRLQAMTDELTGVGNHRRFQDMLAEQFRVGTPFGLILADVDHFKQFNDTFGHQLGDRALRTVASVLESGVGSAGLVCRYGGEEFVALLPGMGEHQAHAMAERLRTAIATHVATALGLENFTLTISMGVACFPIHSREKDGLTGMADLALYEAKARGRNCVRVYHSTLRALNCNVTHRERHTLPTLNTLSALLRAKDEYTYAHSVRVARMAAALANEMGLPEGEVRTVEWGALLHDIGKLEIDRAILQKPTKLSTEEWQIVKQHPTWGADLLAPIPLLSAAVPIVRWHHERADGRGYPDGLGGAEIPLVARIVAVADSFDAMTYVRAYQTRKGAVAAAAEMLHCAGTQFDRDVVDALLALQRRQGRMAE
ncbi:MAG TPA: diguanylate cyclase [Symbiobacteriaceae bacterium]|nr:diguanylate cyclase [Symbiobacteriaceae bacterium]